jgi:Cu(I)-responsive transcriptional regulator
MLRREKSDGSEAMNIGRAAAASGLPAKTIRYYEDIGLIRPDRSQNGYRSYSAEDVHKLTFVARARSHGFTIAECRTLLSLYDDDSRASSDVKRVAEEHVVQIERKIEELRAIHRTLSTLIESCHGDLRPDCPILDNLAGAPSPAEA